MSNEMRFADRIVMVSGAASGIGKAAALEFARQGALVVGADLRVSIPAAGALVTAYAPGLGIGEPIDRADGWNLVAGVSLHRHARSRHTSQTLRRGFLGKGSCPRRGPGPQVRWANPSSSCPTNEFGVTFILSQ
jgi:NAD(P)-dependent dehydrogenase (short-subunit alcohol dehydrogenase family)